MAQSERLLSASILVTALAKRFGGGMLHYDDLMAAIADVPTVDAVEVSEYDAIVEKLENLLCHATGGQYSKAGYSWEDMERMVTDYIEECCQEAVAEKVVQCGKCAHWAEDEESNGKYGYCYCHGYKRRIRKRFDGYCDRGVTKNV